MAKLSILAGATSQSVSIFIQDSSVTTGAGKTGLAFNTASLIAYYAFNGANGGSNVITLATLAAANSAYSSGGFKEIDSTNMPGLYRLDIPNAAIAGSKGRSSVIMLSGAANMAPCLLEIELTGWDNQDAVHGGLTCLPNTAVTTNASLLTSGAGTDQLSVTTGRIDLGKILGTTSVGAVGYVGVDWGQVTNKTTTNALTGTTISTAQVAASVTAGVTVTTNNDKTGYSLTQTFPSNFSSLAISAGGAAKVDGTSALTESYAAQGAALTLAQSLYGINQFLGQHSTSGTTWTVKKRDASTTAKTFTLDSATAPTSITEAT